MVPLRLQLCTVQIAESAVVLMYRHAAVQSVAHKAGACACLFCWDACLISLHCFVVPPLLRACVQESERQVSTSQGHDFARRMGCLYVETSAKTNVAGALGG
jgi:hypothetical protein